jgi:hypothetical protein
LNFINNKKKSKVLEKVETEIQKDVKRRERN